MRWGYRNQLMLNGRLSFKERGKPEYPEKNLSVQSREPNTQHTYNAVSGNRTRATLVGGECSVLPLRNHNCDYRFKDLKFTTQFKFDCIVKLTYTPKSSKVDGIFSFLCNVQNHTAYNTFLTWFLSFRLRYFQTPDA